MGLSEFAPIGQAHVNHSKLGGPYTLKNPNDLEIRNHAPSSSESAATTTEICAPAQDPGEGSLMQNAEGRAYGSGHFGEWIEDELGLPAFQYTCDQTTDPKAVTEVYPGVLSATEHVHQVGNDRLIALVSNYGHVRVRQDEGGPKLLNDYAPEMCQFGGGIG